MSFSQKNENKKSIEEIFRKNLLKIDHFHTVKKDTLVYTKQGHGNAMETDRKKILST